MRYALPLAALLLTTACGTSQSLVHPDDVVSAQDRAELPTVGLPPCDATTRTVKLEARNPFYRGSDGFGMENCPPVGNKPRPGQTLHR